MCAASKRPPVVQKRLIELHLQRGRLLERIATQRDTLSRQIVPLQRALNVGDRIARLADAGKTFVLQHPLAVAAALGTVLVLRPGRTLRWARRALMAWRTWTALRAVVPAFLIRRINDQL